MTIRSRLFSAAERRQYELGNQKWQIAGSAAFLVTGIILIFTGIWHLLVGFGVKSTGRFLLHFSLMCLVPDQSSPG
jgi:hypothetical protein